MVYLDLDTMASIGLRVKVSMVNWVERLQFHNKEGDVLGHHGRDQG